MAVHWSIAVVIKALLPPYSYVPYVANLCAFLVAFVVSYSGHRRFTFQVQGRHKESLPRFFLTALAGFIVNELMLALLLLYTPLPFEPALLLVLCLVAIMTFLLARFWAFRSEQAEEII